MQLTSSGLQLTACALMHTNEHTAVFHNPLSDMSESHHSITGGSQHRAAAVAQPRATTDTVLDAVLQEVADTASRKRTTADSVLEAVLTEVCSTGLGNATSHSFTPEEMHAHASEREETQYDGYASQVCTCLMVSTAQPFDYTNFHAVHA